MRPRIELHLDLEGSHRHRDPPPRTGAGAAECDHCCGNGGGFRPGLRPDRRRNHLRHRRLLLGCRLRARSRALPGLRCRRATWPRAIRDALRRLRAERIGGDARSVEDPALVDDLTERGIPLVLRPGADSALGRYAGWRGHLVGLLHQKGVRITISTGCPAFLNLSATEIHDRLTQAFGWDEAVFDAIAKTSLDAAFCDSVTRASVQKRLECPVCLTT